ncbi:MAG: M1 family metallopeptidase [Pyrinomonadaceae bacterium]
MMKSSITRPRSSLTLKVYTSRLRSSRNAWLSALILAAFFLLTVSWSFAARRERKIESWKPTHYGVAITLDEQLKQIVRARTEITVTTLQNGVSVIDLDFGELTVDSVTVDGRLARFNHSAGLLEVRLPKPVGKGTRLVIAVSYHGKPKDGLVLTNDKDGRPSAVGDNWPNRVHHWIPSLDHPSAKATVTFQITVPAANTVVANGRLNRVQTTSKSARTWIYTEAVPIPPYCMIFAAGQFAKLSPAEPTITPLEYYVQRSDAPLALRGFAPAVPSLKFFSETIAPYPYEKLALIIGATQFGGMENSSAIVFSSTLLNSKPTAPLSSTFGIPGSVVGLEAHEIAHQWFGDSVTGSTWADLWLSEGFATYFAGLFIQRTDGEAAFRVYMKNAADAYLSYAKQKRGPIHDTETEDLFKLLNANNYQKGAWVLHMLRSQLGDQNFFQGIRAYYNTHKDSTATTDDLRAALESASGQDLRQFFSSWIYGAGHPNYEVSWNWNGDKKLLLVRLKQVQPEAMFTNHLALDIVTAKGKQRLVLTPNAKEHIEEIPLEGAPSSIEVDPENAVLKEIAVRPAK